MKKWLSVILALTLVLALFAGCGASESAAASADSAPAAEEQATAEEQPVAEVAESVEASVEEPVEEPVDFTVSDETITYTCMNEFSLSQIGSWNENSAFKKLEELTNVHLEFTTYSMESGQEMFNMTIASGNYPDFFAGNSGWFSGGLDTAVDENIIIDLADYSELMPYYQAIRNDNHDIYINTMTDSGIMPGFYALQDVTSSITGYLLRSDYLEATGRTAADLVTYDDWTAFFKDLNGTLDGDYFFPITGQNGFELGMLLGYNTMGISFDTNGFYLKDGKVTYCAVDDQLKKYTQTLHDWYAAGYLDSDFMSRSLGPGNSAPASIISEENGIGVQAMYFTINNYLDAGAGIEGFGLTPVTYPVENAGEKVHISLNDWIPVAGSFCCIFTSCKDIEHLVTYLDSCYSDELSTLLSWGVEGEAWNYDADGNKVFTELVLNDPEGTTGSKYNFPSAWAYYMDVERNNATADPTALEAQNVWESTVDRENLYNIPKSPTFTTEESEIYSKVMGDVQTLVEENMCKFIVGDRDMSEWDSFVNDVKAMGIEKAIAVQQSCYERYLAR